MNLADTSATPPASTPPAVLPITVRIADAVRMFGLSRATLYRLAVAGRIRLVKVGRRSLLDVASMQRHLAGLPALHQTV